MEKITIRDIIRMKGERKKIAAITAYGYAMAKIVDGAGIPIILVGDSVAMVEGGCSNTLPVTVGDMLYHTRSVVRGRRNALVVTDMPFLSYQISTVEAKRNAGIFVKDGGAEAVKIEGGANVAEIVEAIAGMGIPVMGHVGLMPQAVHSLGGYRVQGKLEKEADKIVRDAKAIEEAGAFSIVLEGIPSTLAREITDSLKIPTIGIGAGPHCDGQILVIHDMLGLFDDIKPSYVKRYADLKGVIAGALNEYKRDVEEGLFPAAEHCNNILGPGA